MALTYFWLVGQLRVAAEELCFGERQEVVEEVAYFSYYFGYCLAHIVLRVVHVMMIIFCEVEVGVASWLGYARGRREG